MLTTTYSWALCFNYNTNGKCCKNCTARYLFFIYCESEDVQVVLKMKIYRLC